MEIHFKAYRQGQKEIVAYNVDDNDVDMELVGKHLSPQDFNEKIDQHNAVVVDEKLL